MSLTATAAALAGIGGTSINWTAAESFAATTIITAPAGSAAAFTVLNNIDIGATMGTANAFCALFHGQIDVLGGAIFSSVHFSSAISRGSTTIPHASTTYSLTHTPSSSSLYICDQVAGGATNALTVTLQPYTDTTPSAICPTPEIEVVFRSLQGTTFVIQSVSGPLYQATWGSQSANGAISVRLRWEVVSGTGRWVQLSSSINLAYY